MGENVSYVVYKDKRKLASFQSRDEATTYADTHSAKTKKVEINPNKIAPADVYIIKLVKDGKTMSQEIYTASIRIRR